MANADVLRDGLELVAINQHPYQVKLYAWNLLCVNKVKVFYVLVKKSFLNLFQVFAMMTVVTMLTADRENVSVMKDGKESSARGDLVTPGVTIMETVMMGPVFMTRAGRGLTALWMGVLMPAVDMVSVSEVLVWTHLSHGPADVTMGGLDKTAT